MFWFTTTEHYSIPSRLFDAIWQTGYPRKAGHFIASMTYRHGRLPLAGPGQLLDLG